MTLKSNAKRKQGRGQNEGVPDTKRRRSNSEEILWKQHEQQQLQKQQQCQLEEEFDVLKSLIPGIAQKDDISEVRKSDHY